MKSPTSFVRNQPRSRFDGLEGLPPREVSQLPPYYDLNEVYEYILRRTLLHKIYEPLTPEIVAIKGYSWSIVSQAIDQINLFTLVTEDGFSYAELGVALIGDALPAGVIKNHLTIRRIKNALIEIED